MFFKDLRHTILFSRSLDIKPTVAKDKKHKWRKGQRQVYVYPGRYRCNAESVVRSAASVAKAEGVQCVFTVERTTLTRLDSVKL